MKKSSTVGILLVIIGVIGLLYVFGSGGKSPFRGVENFFLKQIDHEQIIDIQELDRIAIDTKSVDVHIMKSQRETARVIMHGHATRNNFNFDVKQARNTLNVSSGEKSSFRLGLNITNVKMIVELPEKHWKQITVDASSGSIKLDSLVSDHVELNASSGNVDIKDLSTGSLTAKTSSGSIDLYDIDGENVNVNSSSGNIKMESITANLLTFNASSGNIKLVDGSAQLKGKTSSGSIRINQKEMLHDADLEASSGNINVNLDHEPKSLAVDFRGGSGRGRIEHDGFNYNYQSNDRDRIEGAFGEGEVKLKARTSSGNFTLN